MKRPSIIVDIDGTIADCDHRLHHIRNYENDEEATFKADWDAFYDDALKDRPISPTLTLVQALDFADWCIILVTGRSAKYREVTEQWLQRHKVSYSLLLMRETGDHTDDNEVKRKWLRLLRTGQLSLPEVEFPRIAIEDRDRVVKMWRDEGLVCLQCDEGDF